MPLKGIVQARRADAHEKGGIIGLGEQGEFGDRHVIHIDEKLHGAHDEVLVKRVKGRYQINLDQAGSNVPVQIVTDVVVQAGQCILAVPVGSITGGFTGGFIFALMDGSNMGQFSCT